MVAVFAGILTHSFSSVGIGGTAQHLTLGVVIGTVSAVRTLAVPMVKDILIGQHRDIARLDTS